MTLNFYQYGADRLVATLELDEAQSSIIERINEPTRLSATLTSDTAPVIQIGARTTYKGVTYYVTKEPTVRKEHSKLYTIETELETIIGLARHVILDNPVDKRSSFDYTATATEHVQLVVDSLNGKKLRKIPAWTRGMILGSNKVKHIKYDGVSAWNALQLIRQTYETDLHIDGTAISLGIWGNKNNAIELAYGKGNGILSGLERIKHDDTPTPMSLYVTGTKRNMTKGRLTMQQLETLKVDEDGNILHGDSASGRIFSTDKTGQYISEVTNGDQTLYTEATYTNEEIYPSHVSTIKVVTKVKDHFEVNSDFDYSKLRIEGEQMQVVFQSGNLAGRDFDAKYMSSSGRLAIVPKEEDDTTLPNDTLCPKVGDQYIVTGIKLPDKYIREAQRKLTEEALRHLLKLQQQRYSYKAEIDPVYLHNHKTTIGTKLDVGQYVHLTDQQIAVGDPYIRIISKRTYLDRPYTPEVELSNEVERLSLLEQFMQHADGVISVASDELSKRVSAAEASLGSKLGSEEFDQWREGAFKQVTGRITDAEGNIASQAELLSTHTETLSSQAQLLADQGQQLTTQGESLSSQSQRLTTAEEALTGKLDSGAFAQWQAGELAQSLASKQPAGSYVVPSQLATSAQQTLSEAVKRAEELDKQIKVGGRNLLRAGYFEKVYFRSDTDKLISYDDKDKKITYIGKGSRWNSWIWLSELEDVTTINLRKAIGEYTLSFSVRGRGTVSFEVVGNYKTNFSDCKTTVQTLTEDWQRVSCPFTRSAEDSSLFCLYNDKPETGDWVQFADDWKLERGTVATDWTPAPEDVAASVRTVNTSLVSLASTLESHKTATAQSFAELSNHPLTIDKNGFWQIWSIKDGAYKTTQYPSRGRDGANGKDGENGKDGDKGEKGDTPLITLDSQYRLVSDGKLVSPVSLKGQDAGCYLGRAKRIHPDFNGNYVLETESSWRTAKEGDYVYLVGDDPNRGGDKDTYYIVREHKSKTVWEQYDIKGHSPNPDEVLSTDSFRKQLTSEVTTQMKPVNKRLESIDDKAEEAHTIGSNAQRTANDMTDQVRLAMSGVTDLSNRSLTLDQKRDLGYLTFALKSMTSGSNSTLEGLALQRYIALSGDNQTVSAYLASNALPAVLKAGITNFGTANEREQVEITHQGTGHFGNLYFEGSQIDFKTGRDDAPYLSIGAEEATFIDSFVNNTRVVDTPVSVSSISLTSNNAGYQRTISVANDGTRLTISLEKINVAVYGSSKLRLTLDGETLAEWRGSAKYTDTSGRDEAGGSYKIEYTPYEASNLSYERVVKAGNHTIRLEIATPINGNATVNWLRVRRRYDTGAQQSALTKSGLRLFASPDRYFDVDYRKSVLYSAPNRLSTWQSNPYLVRIKGGAKVDKLTADELDAPGVPLCGASFNENGTQIKAFGKYVNKRGSGRAQAVYDNGMAAFKVYHSIGHTNYIPIVQVSGWASNNINWSLTPRVYNITSEYFVVRILTNNDNPTAKAISYVAYKTE